MRAAALVFALVVSAAVAADNCAPLPATSPSSQIYDLTYKLTTNNENFCSSLTRSTCSAQVTANANTYTYLMCSPRTTQDQCCVDDCYARLFTKCLDNTACMLTPSSGQTVQCVARADVCGPLSNGNATTCDRYSFCTYDKSTGLCSFSPLAVPSVPPGDSVANACPALHPLVIAMLALMFITFVGAVVIVAVVVYRNQKKADEEDERRSQAEAAAAEAKRARSARNRL